MNIYFIEFRDPLFSIIVFFVLVFVITVVSYWWGRYKNQEDSKQLDAFLDSFRTLPSQDELGILINSGDLSQKSWLLLAQSYFNNGDYEKSIEIYNELLKVFPTLNSKDTMFLLGRTYFKAGFLERSKQIFIEILKHNPRTPQVLEYLLLVYENLRDYQSALDVLESLEELKIDREKDRIYFSILELLNNQDLLVEEKVKQLLAIYKDKHQLTYMIFEYFFKIDPKLAWEHLDSSKSQSLVDIFWYLDAKDLNFDIISKNSYLRELYSARGDIALVKESSSFEFDLLIKLNNNANATLNFEYICDNCKQSYPFAFHRCSHCHTLNTLQVEYSLTKDYHRSFSEQNNSFQ
jgi:tetratricopeptide (TPR) repeat protein